MKISAVNQLKGKVVEIDKGAVNARVTIDIGGSKICSVITLCSVDRLGLNVGSDAYAIIKATSVMVGVDE